MQLDFQQFLMKLEKLTDLRPIPDKEFVETYIKAYYLTENDMEQFIKNHRVSSRRAGGRRAGEGFPPSLRHFRFCSSAEKLTPCVSLQEYSMKQLANLVNVCLGSHINKKARQKLLAAIDDIDRPKR